jgi:cell division protein FtsQ
LHGELCDPICNGSGASTQPMARNDGPTTPEDDAQFYRSGRDGKGESSPRRPSRAQIDDSPIDDRVVDLNDEEESPFLRAQKRVSVRRSAIPKKTAVRLRIVVIILTIAACLGMMAAMLYRYGSHSWRFRLESSDNVEVVGAQHVTRKQIMQIMAPDLSRNVFFIPLDQRRKQIEEIPWVESAAVMRLLPNRVKVEVKERTPVAFAQVGSKIELVDATGVMMSTPESQADYSFPVIQGMSGSDPLSMRAAQMKIYNSVMRDLDTNGVNYSKDINEVDLTDPEDVKITVADSQGAVVIHLGSTNFLERYKLYVAHVQEWRQQFPKLNSVDLRYERQVILNPDMRGAQASASGSTSGDASVPAPARVVVESAPPAKPSRRHKPSARHHR